LPCPTTPPAVQPSLLSAQAFHIADRAVVCDIESECPSVARDGWMWRDLQPMLDANEHAPEVIDMARQAIDYALHRGLLIKHPTARHLARLAQRP